MFSIMFKNLLQDLLFEEVELQNTSCRMQSDFDFQPKYYKLNHTMTFQLVLGFIRTPQCISTAAHKSCKIRFSVGISKTEPINWDLGFEINLDQSRHQTTDGKKTSNNKVQVGVTNEV